MIVSPPLFDPKLGTVTDVSVSREPGQPWSRPGEAGGSGSGPMGAQDRRYLGEIFRNRLSQLPHLQPPTTPFHKNITSCRINHAPSHSRLAYPRLRDTEITSR